MRDAATAAWRNQIIIGLQQDAKAAKGKLYNFGENFDPAAQLSDAAPWLQMIKPTKDRRKWLKIISPCDMSQQYALTAYFAIATPE